MSKLELYNIYAGYEESKPVLKDISFFVEKGEFIVLLGTSGCGKTTILNLIAGMIPISAGELYIDGVKSNDTPPRKRNIAMVFQNYALCIMAEYNRNIPDVKYGFNTYEMTYTVGPIVDEYIKGKIDLDTAIDQMQNAAEDAAKNVPKT